MYTYIVMPLNNFGKKICDTMTWHLFTRDKCLTVQWMGRMLLNNKGQIREIKTPVLISVSSEWEADIGEEYVYSALSE